MRASSVPVMCYSFTDVSRFCRSVAVPVALQRHTRTEWVAYKDSAVLNALYGALFWKAPPGFVEIRQADAAVLEESATQLQERFLRVWLRKLAQCGPQGAADYVEQMAKLRDDVHDDVRDLFRDAMRLNSEVRGETADAIKTLAGIKLGASVGVAAFGAVGAITLTGGAALVTSGVSAGYSMACALIKEYERGRDAVAAAVSFEAGKASASETLGWIAGKHSGHALAREARASQILKSAQGVVRQQSERLGQLAAAQGSKRVARQTAKTMQVLRVAERQVAAQQAAASAARTAATAAGAAKVGVPLVFAASDVWGAFGDYQETLRSL